MEYEARASAALTQALAEEERLGKTKEVVAAEKEAAAELRGQLQVGIATLHLGLLRPFVTRPAALLFAFCATRGGFLTTQQHMFLNQAILSTICGTSPTAGGEGIPGGGGRFSCAVRRQAAGSER